MFNGLVEPPQDPIVFPKIQLIFPFRENVAKVPKQVPWEKFLLVADAACWSFLRVQVTSLVAINFSPRRSNPIEFMERLYWSENIAQVVFISSVLCSLLGCKCVRFVGQAPCVPGIVIHTS